MASLVRLTALGCAITTVNARRFESSDDAQSRNPVVGTGQNTDPDPPGWTPKPTPMPGSNNIGLELPQDDDNSIATCATRFMPAPGGIPISNEPTPHCTTYAYRDDYGSAYGGYSMFTCGDSRNPRTIIVGHTASFEYNTIDTSPDMPTISTTVPPSETTGLATSTTNLLSSSSSEAPTPFPVAADGSNSSKTGAIVGGVVGGLGGIALIAAVIFFLYRQKKKAKAAAPPDYITPLGPTYYPGPEDPPLHPNQYGSSSQPMAQATQHDAQGTGYPPVSYPPAATVPMDRHVNGGPSPYYPMPPKTAEDDAAVSPIESTPSVSPPDSPQSPYARTVSPTMPPVQYNRFSPPPPQQFQAYRPYPGT
ncbi:hypothetical protein DL768_005973 [Monosporascus sp. mg162]|nr:hypothetical protein DL768_005973 [Monosporascus sp. mg162]